VSGELAAMAPDVDGLFAMDIKKPSPTTETPRKHVAAKASRKKLSSLSSAWMKPMLQGKVSGQRPAAKVLGVPKALSDTGRPKGRGLEAPGKSSRGYVFKEEAGVACECLAEVNAAGQGFGTTSSSEGLGSKARRLPTGSPGWTRNDDLKLLSVLLVLSQDTDC